jgi:hypothetical protein
MRKPADADRRRSCPRTFARAVNEGFERLEAGRVPRPTIMFSSKKTGSAL